MAAVIFVDLYLNEDVEVQCYLVLLAAEIVQGLSNQSAPDRLGVAVLDLPTHQHSSLHMDLLEPTKENLLGKPSWQRVFPVS